MESWLDERLRIVRNQELLRAAAILRCRPNWGPRVREVNRA